MELEASRRARQPGRLTMAAISAVYTIARVAEQLGEDEDWLHELAIELFPDRGCLYVYGVGDNDVTMALTDDGIEYLKDLAAEARRAGTAPPRITPKP